MAKRSKYQEKDSLEIDPRLGEFIREERKKKGWTVKELSERAGCSTTHITRIELAKREVSSISLMKSIANALEISFWELLKIAIPEEFEEKSPIAKSNIPAIASVSQEKEFGKLVKKTLEADLTDAEVHEMVKLCSCYIKICKSRKK